MDKDFIGFYGKLMKVAEKEFNASCENEEFAKALYKEYLDADSPKPVENWLGSRLTNEFPYVTTAPNWIEDEPAWPYHNGKPMVFIVQAGLPRNHVTESHLTWDKEIYVFGARVPYRTGYRIEYKIIAQSKDL
jgi:hypothetical protein